MMNNSTNITNTLSEDIPITDIPTIWKYIVYLFILVIALLGNALLVMSLYKVNRKRFSITNLLVTNLALSEVLIVISSIPSFIIENSLGYFPFGSIGCRIIFPLSTYGLNSVVFSLVCLSCERFLAICYPFQYHTLRRYAYHFIVSCHLVSFLSVLPYGVYLTEENGTCIETWSLKVSGIYTIFLCSIQYLIPLPLIISLYSYTWFSIKKQNDNVIKNSEKQTSKNETSIAALKNFQNKLISRMDRESSGHRVRHIIRRMKRNKRQYNTQLAILRQKQTMEMLKLFIMIVSVFAIFMLPNQILWLYMTVAGVDVTDTPLTVSDWLTYANAILNPFIYGLNQKYRKLYLSHIQRVLQLCCTELKKRRKSTLSNLSPFNNIGRRSDSVLSSDSSSRYFRKRKNTTSSSFSSFDNDDSFEHVPLFQSKRKDSTNSVVVVLNNAKEGDKSQTKHFKVKTCVNNERQSSVYIDDYTNNLSLSDDNEYLDLFFPDGKVGIKSHRLYKSALTNSIKQKYLPISSLETCVESLQEQPMNCDEIKRCSNNMELMKRDAELLSRPTSLLSYTHPSELKDNRFTSENNNFRIDSPDCKIRLNSDIYIDNKNRLSFFRGSNNILDLNSGFEVDNNINTSKHSICPSSESAGQDDEVHSVDSGNFHESNTLLDMHKKDSVDQIDDLDIQNIELNKNTLKIQCTDGERKSLSFIFNTRKYNILEFLNEATERETDC